SGPSWAAVTRQPARSRPRRSTEVMRRSSSTTRMRRPLRVVVSIQPEPPAVILTLKLAQFDLQVEAPAVPLHGDGNHVTHAVAVDRLDQFGEGADFLALHRHDDVAGLDARPLGAAAGLDGGDPDALAGENVLVKHGGLHRDAQRRARDVALPDQVLDHPGHLVAGQGEAHALHARRPELEGVDADDLAPQVDQGTAAVAGADGRVGLDDLEDPALGEL